MSAKRNPIVEIDNVRREALGAKLRSMSPRAFG